MMVRLRTIMDVRAINATGSMKGAPGSKAGFFSACKWTTDRGEHRTKRPLRHRRSSFPKEHRSACMSFIQCQCLDLHHSLSTGKFVNPCLGCLAYPQYKPHRYRSGARSSSSPESSTVSSAVAWLDCNCPDCRKFHNTSGRRGRLVLLSRKGELWPLATPMFESFRSPKIAACAR